MMLGDGEVVVEWEDRGSISKVEEMGGIEET